MSGLILETTVGAALDAAVRKWGDADGWVFDRDRLSFTELQLRAHAAARALIGLGLKKGDVVATWMPNLPEWLVLQMACARVGVILAGLSTRFKTEEVRYVLEHGDAAVLICTPSFMGIDFREMLFRVAPALSAARLGQVTDPSLPRLRCLVELGEDIAPQAMAWRDFLALGRDVDEAQVEALQVRQAPDDAVLLKYTSGTTSFPKGVLINHREALYWGAGIFSRLGIGEGEPILNTQPFYHAGGSCGALTVPLTLGCRIVSPSHYSVENVLGLIERERCVARTGSAAMYLMEVSDPAFGKFDLSSLRAAWCVGPPAVFQRIREATGIEKLVQPFGSTETGGTCASVDDSWEQRTASCGRPLPGIEMKVVDPETGRALDTDMAGEICFRGWWRMNGYYKLPQESAQVSLPGGWLKTGDLGSIDGDGCLHFVGRLKDTIRPGGENVSAAEVEAFLLKHPGVRQVAVIGVPDARLGEVVMAVIEPRDDANLTAEGIVAFCRGNISNLKVPRHVRFTNEWPMTGSGKIQKFELRKRYAAEFDDAAGHAEVADR